MTRPHFKVARIVGSLVLIGGLLSLSESFSPMSGPIVTSAEARIGRPMTPMSYAGVARRTTRRAVVGGAAVAGGAYYGSNCYQVADAYGQVYTQCQ
jgi:hypothetical protein